MGSTTATNNNATEITAMTVPKRNNTSPNTTTVSSPIIQADELCFNPRWSPQLKSPPRKTLSFRLQQQQSQISGVPSDPENGDSNHHQDTVIRGPDVFSSPLSKRARVLQGESPSGLPPLSPVVNSRKRSSRAGLEVGPDSPLPFSPTTGSGLKIRYPRQPSPLSPTLRNTLGMGEPLPRSPSLTDMLDKEDSPTLLHMNESFDSQNISQIGSSLFAHLELESPTSRKESSLAPPKIKPLFQHSPRALSFEMGSDEDSSQPQPEKRLSGSKRRLSASDRSDSITETSSARQRRKLASLTPSTEAIPQIFISPLNPRKDQTIESLISQQLEQARSYFNCNFGAREIDFVKVTTEVCGLPRFANRALFRYVTRDSNTYSKPSFLGNSSIVGKRTRPIVSNSWPPFAHFCSVWAQLRRASSDVHALLFNILVDDATISRPFITRQDVKPLVTDVLDHHYELEFLECQGEFAMSYTETVIERLFYVANRSWDGKITLSQFRKADIVGILRAAEDGIDVEVEDPTVFSYKHFYVLYCSFFELDTNRDRLLDARDLLRYFNSSLSRRAISRIMMGKGKPSEHIIHRRVSANDARVRAKAERRRAKSKVSRYDQSVRLSDCRMTYCDFIWFLLSEIDKTTPAAIDYWFRCLDLDGDGILTIYELEYFYDEQVTRMAAEMAGDIVLLDDLMCQLTDMIRPEHDGMFTLRDLRRASSKLVPVFFDAFVNLDRYIEHESYTTFLQRQLAQLSLRALPTTSFGDVIQLRMDFLASLPSPWVEFADCEYSALLNDQVARENSANGTVVNADVNSINNNNNIILGD